ncbi:MAG: hypothetical protein ACO3B3_01740 [Cyanobium sp.]
MKPKATAAVAVIVAMTLAMKRLTIVGNAPLSRDLSAFVDQSDLVLRIGWPRTWGGESGSRFDIWVLQNGKGGRGYVESRCFLACPFRDLAREIWFPRALGLHNRIPLHPSYGGCVVDAALDDISLEILKANDLRQPWIRLDEAFYARCISQLFDLSNPDCVVLMPSTGFLAAHYVFETMPDYRLTMVGFSFEGWPGHPWTLEQAHIASLASQGRLEFIPA